MAGHKCRGGTPCLYLVPVPLQLLDLLLEVPFQLFFLVNVVSVIDLQVALGLRHQGTAIRTGPACRTGRLVNHVLGAMAWITRSQRGNRWKETIGCAATGSVRDRSLRPRTLSQISSNESRPSRTFFMVLSISCCSLRAAPILPDAPWCQTRPTA